MTRLTHRWSPDRSPSVLLLKAEHRKRMRERAAWIRRTSWGSALLVFLAILPNEACVSDRFSSNIDIPTVALPQISAYDDIIQRTAKTHNLDWRLVAAMISVESRFDHQAVSPKGASGLMQIMPVVAREQAVFSSHNPKENIRAGVRHFGKGLERIKGHTPDDALRLSLAAYNAGLGHLRDAQRLAIEMGKSPRRWKDVREALLLLESPEHFTNATYGYCKGTEAVEYVDRVIRQFDQYKKEYSANPVTYTQLAKQAKARNG